MSQQDRLEEIRAGMKVILFEDSVLCSITHENAPPHKDCYDDCGVISGEGGRKHKKCMECWNEYIDDLVLRIERGQSSQGVWIRTENGEDLTGCCLARLEPLIEVEK